MDDPFAAADGADALVIATEWPDYRELDAAQDPGRAARQPRRRRQRLPGPVAGPRPAHPLRLGRATACMSGSIGGSRRADHRRGARPGPGDRARLPARGRADRHLLAVGGGARRGAGGAGRRGRGPCARGRRLGARSRPGAGRLRGRDARRARHPGQQRGRLRAQGRDRRDRVGAVGPGHRDQPDGVGPPRALRARPPAAVGARQGRAAVGRRGDVAAAHVVGLRGLQGGDRALCRDARPRGRRRRHRRQRDRARGVEHQHARRGPRSRAGGRRRGVLRQGRRAARERRHAVDARRGPRRLPRLAPQRRHHRPPAERGLGSVGGARAARRDAGGERHLHLAQDRPGRARARAGASATERRASASAGVLAVGRAR